jgi:hypothetical protein
MNAHPTSTEMAGEGELPLPQTPSPKQNLVVYTKVWTHLIALVRTVRSAPVAFASVTRPASLICPLFLFSFRPFLQSILSSFLSINSLFLLLISANSLVAYEPRLMRGLVSDAK